MADEKNSAESKNEAKPTWLDAAFVQEALRIGGETNPQVKELTTRAASAPGDNYGSALYRMKATLADGEERSLILKVPPPGEDIANVLEEAGLFPREITMLGHVLPEMHVLLEAAAPGRYPPLAPRCLHHGSSPCDFLVLEDLVPQGFKMADRHKGLGLRHSLIALRALARFHAASVTVLERNPSVANSLDNPYKTDNTAFVMFIEQCVQGTADACRSWPGFEEYARILDAFKATAMKTFQRNNDAKPETFNVITHGDFWMNNMMFRYEEGEVRGVSVFDLQISHVAPAVVDVLYFLSNSLSENVSEHHQDLLLREYHSALAEAMELLGLQPPSLEALLADVQSHGVFSLFGALGVLPLVKTQTAPDMNAAMTGDQNATSYLYRDPVVKRWLQRVLPEYKAKGWLPS